MGIEGEKYIGIRRQAGKSDKALRLGLGPTALTHPPALLLIVI